MNIAVEFHVFELHIDIYRNEILVSVQNNEHYSRISSKWTPFTWLLEWNFS